MGQKSDTLFNWIPSDGLDKLTITASSGAASYSLTSTELRVNCPANISVTTYIKINPTFRIPSKYKVTIVYGNAIVSGKHGWQLAVTSRFDSRINARTLLGGYSQEGDRIAICGQQFPLQSIPSDGVISMEYDKTSGAVKGYLNDSLIGTVQYTQDQSTNEATVWCNSKTICTFYIKRITIEEMQ